MTINLCMPSGLSLDSTTATASDIFKSKTAYNGNGELITGTYSFPSTTASASDIFKGKTAINSSGSVITGTYSFPSVNVTAGNMLSGTSAINSSGSVVNGSMVNRGSPAATLSVGGSKSYSAGYYSAGIVKVNSLPATTASASDIRSGKVALNNSGTAITGTLYIPARLICAIAFCGPYTTGGDGTPIFSYVMYSDSNYISTASVSSVTFKKQATVRIRGTFNVINTSKAHSLVAGSTTLISVAADNRGYHAFDKTLTLNANNRIYRDSEIYQLGCGYAYTVELA